jgi:hypothetical protein
MVQRTDVVRGILWIVLIGLAILWAYKYKKLIEGFQDTLEEQETQLTNEITGAVTKISETLCPIIKETLEKLQSDLMSEEEQRKGIEKLSPERRQQIEDGALHQMKMASMGMSPDKLLVSKELKGLLFPCPPPTDPNEIPVDIGLYILGTAKVCGPIATEIKATVAKSRECPKTEPKKEAFEANTQLSFQFTTKEAFEDVAASTDPAVQQARITTLKLKLLGIKNAFADPTVIQMVADYKEIKEIKQQAESGSLTPNCDV